MSAQTIRRKLTAIAAIFGILFAWPSRAFAWGNEGHEIVAEVALKILDGRGPAFRQRFNAILTRDILDYSYTYVDDGRMRSRTCTGDDIGNASIWPDCVRNSDRYGYTRGYHYDDIRRCTNAAVGNMPARDGYCRDGNCATAALRRYIAQIRNPDTSPREKAEALVWIIHIVGDLHQPLHATDNRDGGGNSVNLTYTRQGQNGPVDARTKFHSFWDGAMVLASTKPSGWTRPQVPLTARIDLIHALASAPQPQWRFGPLNFGTFTETAFDPWVVQSHALSQRAYDALRPVPGCDVGRIDARAPTSYFTDFRTATQEQLASAAVRLADVLAQVL